MADTKLSGLTELAATPADDDEVYIRDVSEVAADESKRITIVNLLAGAPTKEFFVPATGGTESTTYTFHTAYKIDAAADNAYIVFYIPNDFSSITAAVVVRVAVATATHRLNYNADYGALGQAANIHQESLTDQDTAETSSRLYEQDISGILSSLATGDFVGIRVLGDATNVPVDMILGVRFKYS